MAEPSPLSQSSSSQPSTTSSPASTNSGDPVSTVSRINARIIGICVAAALGGFLFGFDTAVINGFFQLPPFGSICAVKYQFALPQNPPGGGHVGAFVGNIKIRHG